MDSGQPLGPNHSACENRIASVCATWYYMFRTQPSPFLNFQRTYLLTHSNSNKITHAHIALKVLEAPLKQHPNLYTVPVWMHFIISAMSISSNGIQQSVFFVSKKCHLAVLFFLATYII